MMTMVIMSKIWERLVQVGVVRRSLFDTDCSFQPLAKARSSVQVVIAIGCSLLRRRLIALGQQAFETGRLLGSRWIATAHRCSSVHVSSLRLSVEERHLDQLLRMLRYAQIKRDESVVA
jgi:hypothetical protein